MVIMMALLARAVRQRLIKQRATSAAPQSQLGNSSFEEGNSFDCCPLTSLDMRNALRKKSKIADEDTWDIDSTPINAESFDRRLPSEDLDEEDGSNEESVSGGGTHFHDGDEVEEDPPEWEMGIRRSSSSKSCRIEDLTLSDIILDPDGNVTYYWLGMVTVAVVYNVASIVLRLAFHEMRETETEDSIFYTLDTISDLIFVLDIFVHLRISFYEDGCLVLDPTRIMGKYTQSSKFLVDVVSIVPLATMYSCVSIASSICFIDLSMYIPGNIRVMLLRLPRMLKYPAMVRFFDFTDSRTRNPNFLRAFKLSLNLWIVIHWVGCVYYVVSEYEGLGSNSWVYPNGTDYSPFSRKYIRVMYWSLMTLTTIGERPPPETDLEFVFTGFTFLIGVFVFAAVVGNVGDVISNMNAARTEFQSRMDQIKSYLQHRNVDEKLQNRVKRWADYTWTRTQSIDEPSLLQMLPDRLRTEIAINVHLETLKKVKIFEECEEGLLRELVLKLRPQVYSPGDIICRTGEVGREMFIVNHGKVEIMVPNHLTGRKAVVATLSPGNYFGEISLLKMDDGHNRRTADVRAVGYSELLRLSRKDLMSALVEYPNAKRILEQQALERIEKTKEMRRSSTTDDVTSPDSSSDGSLTGRRKNMLLSVIKSENFKNLISTRNTEMSEMKKMLEDVRQFDSQITKDRITFLQHQVSERDQELKAKGKENILLKNKISRLLSKDKAFRVYHPHSPVLIQKQSRVSNGTDPTCKCYTNSDNSNTANGTDSKHSVCICRQQTQPRRRSGQVSRKRYSSNKMEHFPSCYPVRDSSDTESCNCRYLRKSVSVPDVFNAKQGNQQTSLPNSPDQKLPKTIAKDNSQCDVRPSNSTWPQRHNFTNPRNDKDKHGSGPSRMPNGQTMNVTEELNGPDEHELEVIEKLLELDAECLSDSTGHSSDQSSDELDLD